MLYFISTCILHINNEELKTRKEFKVGIDILSYCKIEKALMVEGSVQLCIVVIKP